MNKQEAARSCFSKGHNCAQSVLSVFAGDFGLSEEMALKAASIFGGGIAGTGETCGAITGALMVIGLRYGSTDVQDKDTKEKMRTLGRELMGAFKSIFGSTKCKELLGCDIGMPEGMEQARTSGLFMSRCPELVDRTVQLLEKIL
jgi:C_GCAxxG_C_C family probable redox protein